VATASVLYAGDRNDTWKDVRRARRVWREREPRVVEICEVEGWRWSQDALCRGTSPEDWFSDVHPTESADTIATLLRICAQCPVRAQCLAHAVEHNEWGIWGGTTDDERRKLAGRGKRR
jgi:WhiB family redox-sensing transcriptional regulator